MPDSSKNHRRRGPRASWSGRPLTLIIGWVLSCALVTGVTLTAVGRVGHEISGTQPQVTTEQQVNKQLTQQDASSSAPAEPVSSTQPIAPTPSASRKAGTPVASTKPSPSPSATPTHHLKPSNTPTPGHPATPSAKPSTTPSKAAVKPTVAPVSSPPASSASGTAVPSSPTASPSASATALTGKKTIKVPGNNAPIGGEIIIACSGDTIGQYAIVLTAGSKFSYTTPNPPPDPSIQLDVTFVDPSTTTTYHYVVSCADGQVVGSQPLTERAS